MIFYCHSLFGIFIVLHSFALEINRESYKKLCKNKDFCSAVLPSENTIILEFNQYQKSDKAPFVIYPDLECLIEKIDRCKNIPENLFTIKVSDNIPSDFLMSTISYFKIIENKHDVYRGKYLHEKVLWIFKRAGKKDN